MFLHQEIGEGGIQRNRRGQRDGAKRGMERHLRIDSLSNGGDLLTFGNAAGVGQVGLHHGQRPLAQRIKEDPLAHPAFTGSDRGAGGLSNLIQHIDPFHWHRFFNKEGAQRLQRRDHLHSNARMGVVDVHRHVDARAGGFFDGCKDGCPVIHFGGRLQAFARAKVRFQGAETPFLHQSLRVVSPSLWIVAAPVGFGLCGVTGAIGLSWFHRVGQTAAGGPIHAYMITASAAQHLMQWQSRRLAGNVPERHVDATERAHGHRSAFVAQTGVVHGIPERFDLARIFAQ